MQLGAGNPAYKLALPPDEDNACYSLGIYVINVDQVFENAASLSPLQRIGYASANRGLRHPLSRSGDARAVESYVIGGD